VELFGKGWLHCTSVFPLITGIVCLWKGYCFSRDQRRIISTAGQDDGGNIAWLSNVNTRA
jgi:hypothetical protein